MRTALIYNFLIEANIMAGMAILLMIPVRRFFRKYLGNRAICFAWLLVAIRLVCPLALPNPLMNEIVTPFNDQPEVIRPMAGQIRVRLSDALNEASWNAIDKSMANEKTSFSEALSQPGNAVLSSLSHGMGNGRTAQVFMQIYLAGLGGTALWFGVVNVRFQRKLKSNRMEPLSGELRQYYEALCEKYRVRPLPVYFVDPLSSACLVGGIRPYIALPLAAEDTQIRQMLAHELCHYKAGDHLWTLLTLLCCAAHWFNPLVWAAGAMSRMDRELKCDDSVTRDMDEDARRLYAGTLIQSITRRTVPGMPMLATGMSMTGRKMKIRVGGILRGGKRVKGAALAFAAAASLLLVCAFGTAAYGETPNWNEISAPYLNAEVQTLEEALASEKAIPTEAEAIERAKALLSSDYYGIDTDNPEMQWRVETRTGIYDKMCYYITGCLPSSPADQVYVSMAVDGSGTDILSNGMNPYYTKDYVLRYEYTPQSPLTREQMDRITQFCLAFTELAEPGESQYFREIYFNGFLQAKDTLYAQLEAPYSDSTSKTFIVQVTPELKMVDYWSGNG